MPHCSKIVPTEEHHTCSLGVPGPGPGSDALQQLSAAEGARQWTWCKQDEQQRCGLYRGATSHLQLYSAYMQLNSSFMLEAFCTTQLTTCRATLLVRHGRGPQVHVVPQGFHDHPLSPGAYGCDGDVRRCRTHELPAASKLK